MDDREDDLAEAIRELSATLSALRDELEGDVASRGPRRRPFPLRPPTPSELARFGDEVAIPALIATLEANIRALETLRRGLKVARGQRAVRDSASDAADLTARRSSEVREVTLTHLDRALGELQDAVSGDADEVGVKVDDRTRSLLEDARRLRDDVDRRLARRVDDPDAESRSQTAYRIDIQSGDPDSDRNRDRDRDRNDEGDSRRLDRPNDSEPGVDVDAELETLKDRYGNSSRDVDDASRDDSGDSADDTDSGHGDTEEDGEGQDEDRTGSNEAGTDSSNGGAERGGDPSDESTE